MMGCVGAAERKREGGEELGMAVHREESSSICAHTRTVLIAGRLDLEVESHA